MTDTEPRTTTASAELTRIHYPPRPGLNGPTSFLYGLAIALALIVLGGYVAVAYRVTYVLDFAVYGPALIVAAAVTTTGALVAHSHSIDHQA